MFKRPTDGLWAGLVVGILLVTLLMALHVDVNGGGDVPKAQAVVTSVKAAQSFVNAWQRMTFGNWSVTSSYTRLLPNGQTYRVTELDAQRPPDYLTEAPSVTTGSVGGRLVTCAAVRQAQVSGCKDNGAAPPFAAYAQSKVTAVESLVLGPNVTYQVEAQGGQCFQLFLAPGMTANTWGNRARFCFDQVTGAPVLTVIYTDAATDTTQATQVRAPVAGDFVITSAP